MNRNELALAIMSQLAGGPGEQHALDRIRVQKAVFLLTQRGNPNWRELYDYRPYNWGPYSSQLAADMDTLVGQGLAEVVEVPGSRYGAYRTTAEGEAAATSAWSALQQTERDFIRSVRRYVIAKSFTQLLREVYAEYPEFATASHFSG